MQYNRISADCHLDLPWLPPELFVSNARAEFKDRMPYVTDSEDGPLWIAKGGKRFGLVAGVGPTGSKYVPGRDMRADAMAATGLFAEGKKGNVSLSDPHFRIEQMDKDGVDAEVIYGILGVSTRLNDVEASNEMIRIYNDFLVEFGKPYPQRQLALACIPAADINYAAAEVRRVAKNGIRGVEVSTTDSMLPTWHPSWDPLWEAIEETKLPLHFHTFPDMKNVALLEKAGPELRSASFFTGTITFQLNVAPIIAGMMGAAVFERFPNIRVALGECGTGWLPYFIDRMDITFEESYPDLKLKMKPSEYWRRQCRASFQYDRVGAHLVDKIGVETLMWGSDFPHVDGLWPDSDAYIEKQFGHLPPEVTRKITCDNAAEFYGFH
jgi:predicted TIM-barrel fold metal-dependent hydrolase